MPAVRGASARRVATLVDIGNEETTVQASFSAVTERGGWERSKGRQERGADREMEELGDSLAGVTQKSALRY